MLNKVKINNWTAVFAAAFALAIAGTSSLADYVNAHLAQLPVKRMASRQDAQAELDVQKLFPVWVASSAHAKVAGAAGSVERLFQSPAANTGAAQDASVEPDYASLLGSRMVLESIAATGAFINGKFYRVGEAVPDFEYPLHGKQVVPVLAKIEERSVLITHGARRLALSL